MWPTHFGPGAHAKITKRAGTDVEEHPEQQDRKRARHSLLAMNEDVQRDSEDETASEHENENDEFVFEDRYPSCQNQLEDESSDTEEVDDAEDDRRLLALAHDAQVRRQAERAAALAQLEKDACAAATTAAALPPRLNQELEAAGTTVLHPDPKDHDEERKLAEDAALDHIAHLVPHLNATMERFYMSQGAMRGPRDAPPMVARLFRLCAGITTNNGPSMQRVKQTVVERIAAALMLLEIKRIRESNRERLPTEAEQRAVVADVLDWAQQSMSSVRPGLDWWSDAATVWIVSEPNEDGVIQPLRMEQLYVIVRQDVGEGRFQELGLVELERNLHVTLAAQRNVAHRMSPEYVHLQASIAGDRLPCLERVQEIASLHAAANFDEIQRLKRRLQEATQAGNEVIAAQCRTQWMFCVGAVESAVIQYLNRFWGKFMSLGKACMVQELGKVKGGTVLYEPKFQGLRDFASIYHDYTVTLPSGPALPTGKDPRFWASSKQGGESEQRQFLADFWLHHPECRKFAGIKFDPQGPAVCLRELPVAPPASEDYNLWRGFTITEENANEYARRLATAEDPSGALACGALARPFTEHIRRIWCRENQAHYDYVMRWFATILQLRKQNGTSLILQSQEGAGKGVVFDKIGGEIIGPDHYFDCHDIEDALGVYTNQMRGKVLVFLDEVTWGGNRSSGDRLKKLITQPTQRYNAKYEPVMTVESFANVAMAGNNEWIAPCGVNQRRLFMLALSDQYSGRQSQQSKAYFDSIVAVPAVAIAHVLYHVNLEGFNARDFESTSLERDQQMRSFDTLHHWWNTCLSEGDIDGVVAWSEVQDDAVATRLVHNPGTEPWGQWCDKNSIYRAFVTFSATIRRGAFQTKPVNEFWKLMSTWTNVDARIDPAARAPPGEDDADAVVGPVHDQTIITTFDKPLKRMLPDASVPHGPTRQTRLVRMPSLEQCRRGWREKAVMQQEWEH